MRLIEDVRSICNSFRNFPARLTRKKNGTGRTDHPDAISSLGNGRSMAPMPTMKTASACFCMNFTICMATMEYFGLTIPSESGD